MINFTHLYLGVFSLFISILSFLNIVYCYYFKLYLNINRAVVKELLTGELTFGRRNIATANYALNGPNIAIHEINDDYVNWLNYYCVIV